MRVCVCVKERGEGGRRVSEGAFETEKESLVVEAELSGCKLMLLLG